MSQEAGGRTQDSLAGAKHSCTAGLASCILYSVARQWVGIHDGDTVMVRRKEQWASPCCWSCPSYGEGHVSGAEVSGGMQGASSVQATFGSLWPPMSWGRLV